MFAFSALCMTLLGVCIALPLESPDQASPMLEPEPSVIQHADQSEVVPNLEPVSMGLETSSDAVEYFDARIIGGSNAPETKHMVALLVGWHIKSFTCGGSLISPRHILTAAHCVYKDWMHGGLLESYHGIVGSNTWDHGGSIVEFESSMEHPEYDIAAIKNDCSVIKTKMEVHFNHRVQPIRLQRTPVASSVPCYATGWGALSVWGGAAQKLQILYLETISEKKCLSIISDVLGHHISPPIDYAVEICGFHSLGHGMCFGDSGSALVSLLNKFQIGIVSWGYACALGVPDIFVNVPAMGGFIRHAIDSM